MTDSQFSILEPLLTPFKKRAGSIMVGLVFMVATFSIVIYALLLVIGGQFDFSFRQVASDRALNIAEAGANYYRWHLAHDPEDFQDGTGAAGPYVHDYRDPQGDKIGEFSLEITPAEDGSSVVTVASTGWASDFPNIKRTVTAQYGQASLASYAFLSDSSLWFGKGITVGGPVHSNNGIRMDGKPASTVTSAKETYTCGVETGCWPKTKEKPGVWGSGKPKDLWEFPVPAVDFGAFSVDLAQMRVEAQNEGIYLAASGVAGYHLVFSDDGTVSVYRVLSTDKKRGYTPDDGCQNLYQIIVSEEFLATYSTVDNHVLFAEDILWVEGTVKGQISVVAARFPIGTFETNIWIPDNIIYAEKDGTNKLGLMAQHDIYLAYGVPDEFEIDAAMVAQTGKILRHDYSWRKCKSPKAKRRKLTIFGTVISKEKSYWNWGGPVPSSGFREREIVYDQSLIYQPPPYYPTMGDLELISWKEE